MPNLLRSAMFPQISSSDRYLPFLMLATWAFSPSRILRIHIRSKETTPGHQIEGFDVGSAARI